MDISSTKEDLDSQFALCERLQIDSTRLEVQAYDVQDKKKKFLNSA